jgi:hypothetical protein
MQMDILEDLKKADLNGVYPPHNWTTRAADEISQLRQQIERAKTYKGVEGYPCPLCEYKDGIFIKYCELHRQINELNRRLEEHFE